MSNGSGARSDEEDASIERYVEADPLALGPSEAQIVDHGVSVWALIAHLAAADNDKARTATDYGLDIDTVEAAVRYYCRHRALIDARILLNRSYFSP
jgi:uncharacterized protein (DUF433 family)